MATRQNLIRLISLLLAFCSKVNASFYSTEHPPQQVSQSTFSRAKNSVFRFSSNGNLCTGFYISKDGTFVTAMHCFHNCFKELRHVESQVGAPIDGVYKIERKSMEFGATFCVIDLPGSGITTASILDAGTGFTDNDVESTLLASKQYGLNSVLSLRKDGFGPDDDFVVAKMDSLKNSSCVPLESKPRQEKTIWTLGFPGPAQRTDGHSSDGISMHLSVGEINISGLENQCLDPEKNDNDGLGKLLDTPGTMWTTLDSANGASGSPTFNPQGEVSGIAIQILTNKGSAVEHCPGGTQVLKISNVVNLLKKKFGKESFSKINSCD